MKKLAIDLKLRDVIYSTVGNKLCELTVGSLKPEQHYIEVNHAYYFLRDSTIGFSKSALSNVGFNHIVTDFSKENFDRKMSNYLEMNNVVFTEKDSALHKLIKIHLDLIEEKRNYVIQMNKSIEELENNLVELNNQL